MLVKILRLATHRLSEARKMGYFVSSEKFRVFFEGLSPAHQENVLWYAQYQTWEMFQVTIADGRLCK